MHPHLITSFAYATRGSPLRATTYGLAHRHAALADGTQAGNSAEDRRIADDSARVQLF